MSPRRQDKPGALIALIAVQSLCAAFFLWDVVMDLAPWDLRALTNLHVVIEALAALALVSAIVFETRYLMRLLRRKAHLESQVSIAAGAMAEIIETHFDEWALTPAERDVAMFAIKGFSVAETAKFRGSAEGTVKSQLNAVYRKADVPGRGALLGLLVGDRLDMPLVPSETRAAA